MMFKVGMNILFYLPNRLTLRTEAMAQAQPSRAEQATQPLFRESEWLGKYIERLYSDGNGEDTIGI
jgi:hypothetical protein